MKERHNKIIKRYVVVLLCGAGYAVFVLVTGWGIPCPIYTITGLKCPACGVSRMILSVLRLDFSSAYQYNPFLFVFAPLLLFCIIYPDVVYIKTGRPGIGRLGVVYWIVIAAALIFGVLRNII